MSQFDSHTHQRELQKLKDRNYQIQEQNEHMFNAFKEQSEEFEKLKQEFKTKNRQLNFQLAGLQERIYLKSSSIKFSPDTLCVHPCDRSSSSSSDRSESVYVWPENDKFKFDTDNDLKIYDANPRAGGRLGPLGVQLPQLPRCGNDLEAKKVGHNQARYDRRIFLQLRCTVRLLAVPSEASACYIRHIGLMHAVATDSAGRGVSPAAALHGALRPESLTRSVALAAFSVASSQVREKRFK